ESTAWSAGVPPAFFRDEAEVPQYLGGSGGAGRIVGRLCLLGQKEKPRNVQNRVEDRRKDCLARLFPRSGLHAEAARWKSRHLPSGRRKVGARRNHEIPSKSSSRRPVHGVELPEHSDNGDGPGRRGPASGKLERLRT